MNHRAFPRIVALAGLFCGSTAAFGPSSAYAQTGLPPGAGRPPPGAVPGGFNPAPFPGAAPGGLAPAPTPSTQPAPPPPPGTPAKPNPAVKRGNPALLAVLKTSNALLPPNIATIRAFVDTEMDAIASGDAASVRDARLKLIEAASAGTNPATPKYASEYAAAVNAAALKNLKSPEARVRIATAITLQGVASRAPSASLYPAIIAALEDQSEAVAMWGVKAAKYIFPILLADTAAVEQINTIAYTLLARVKANPGSNEVVEDAFETLFGLTAQQAPTDAGILAKRKRLIPLAIAWLQIRADSYVAINELLPLVDQAGFPAAPDLETRSAAEAEIRAKYPSMLLLLCYDAVIKKQLSEEQTTQVGQALFDMTDQLLRIAPKAAVNPGANQPFEGPSQQELTALLKSYAGGLKVLLDSLEGSATPANKAMVSAAANDGRALAQATISQNWSGAAQSLTALKSSMTAANLVGKKAVLAPPAKPAAKPTTNKPAQTRPGVVPARPVAGGTAVPPKK